MNMPTKILTLEQFPPVPSPNGRCRIDVITLYLRDLLHAHLNGRRHGINLPGLGEMAKFFGVPQLDVFDAFQNLRREGYDYSLEGFETPVTFWEKQ